MVTGELSRFYRPARPEAEEHRRTSRLGSLFRHLDLRFVQSRADRYVVDSRQSGQVAPLEEITHSDLLQYLENTKEVR